ncbi:MAG: ribose-phosphate diphosphokinase [Bacilli bacterium]|jgi:ribose-phosphate pyrophosphokinase
MFEKSAVFALTANVKVTDEICTMLGIRRGLCEVKHFADGEIIVETLESVRGKHVYVVQSTCAPVTERLMELLIFVDALNRASAREITCIIPYYGYGRQDRQAKAREPVTARLVADLLQTAGVDRVVSFDLHAPQIQGFFKCPVDNMSAINLIGRYLRRKLASEIAKEEVVVVSPDHGGVTRARNLADYLSSSIAIFDKRRPKPNIAEIVNIIGDVKDKVAVIVDDMIDTGGTILAATKFLIEKGAKKVYAACTHPVFSNDALTKLEESALEEIVVTNTIPLQKESPRVKVLSIGKMLSQAINVIENAESLTAIYDLYKA